VLASPIYSLRPPRRQTAYPSTRETLPTLTLTHCLIKNVTGLGRCLN
jgi:hypothetical protein